MKKEIFGKKVLVTVSENLPEVRKILEAELRFYKNWYTNNEPDVKISIYKSTSAIPKILQQNPKNHFEFDGGFGIDYGPYMIFWKISKPLEITLVFKKRGFLRKILEKIISVQFTYTEQAIGQIIHENILVPLTFFFNDIAPIHGASIVVNDRVIIFGGTGGAGKSSILLRLSESDSVFFGSDDMIIACSDGTVYLNFAYPKLYAYNVIGNKTLEKIILKNSSLIEKVNWFFRKKYNPSKVRKRIPPNLLWRVSEYDHYKIDTYFIFNRGNFESVTVKELDIETAVISTLKIITAEYWNFINHILWHSFNKRLLGIEPFINSEKIWEQWKKVFVNVFSNTRKILRVDIPMDIEHNHFLTQFENIVLKEVNFGD